MYADIRLDGRRWGPEELERHDELPGRLELVRGQLCLDEAQRLLLLSALLEHVGTALAVRLGPIEPWIKAIELRKDDEAWANTATVGCEQFWRPATQRLAFKDKLAMKRELHARRRKAAPHR